MNDPLSDAARTASAPAEGPPLSDRSLDVLKKTFIALKQAQARVEALEARRTEPIAVVGLACRLPGGAESADQLWEVMQRGDDTCTEVPADRWPQDRFYAAGPDAPGRTHAARAHFLTSPVGDFDAPFFGISGREAMSLDPQQRLLLEVTWQALEDAGIDPTALRGSRTGVFTGISSDDYAQAHRHSGRLELIDGYALTGTCFAPAAGRVSYSFGFEGPSIAVDTACSSSLVAVHLACQSLRDREVNLALAGGVNLILSPVFHIASSKLGTISPDGLCKTFDASADGYGRGEGCAVVALKRLADATAAGDRILAVIRGSAVNQDGKSNGLTAPSGLAQERVIREAIGRAGLTPADIDYFEVHGTGTSLGDPIEVEAIGRVVKGFRADSAPVILSTVKSNIGHLEAAAGVAGLVKAIVCLRAGELPAHLHLDNPSPHIPWGQYPFKVVTEPTPIPASGRPLRAGVSSFGFSGTNAHVILEAPSAAAGDEAAGSGACLLPLSARTPEALRALAQQWIDWMDAPTAPLASACATAGEGRAHFANRLAVLGASPQEMSVALRAYLDGKPSRNLAAGVASGERPKTAALFTGQGSQYVGMGRALYAVAPRFRAVIDACDAAFQARLGVSILDLMHGEDASDEALRQTGNAQPVLFAIELALYRLWESWGVRADVVCGHSIGEYVAAHVAGYLGFEDAVALVAERGRLMQQLPSGGAMAAVFAPEAAVADVLAATAGLCLAAVNTPTEVVISGPGPAIDMALEQLAERGVTAHKLNVSHAFHSTLMRPMAAAFAAAAEGCTYQTPTMAAVSTVSGRRAAADELASARYWSDQIESSVRFADAVHTMEAEGVGVFLEVGPAPILAGLVTQSLTSDAVVLGSLQRGGADDRRAMLDSLGKLYAGGASIDWAAVRRSFGGGRAVVPGYPFQRKTYYQAPLVDAGGRGAAAVGDAHPLLGQTIRSPALPSSAVVHQARFEADRPAFLKEHQIFGRIISPAAAHISMALAAGGRRSLEDVSFTAPLVIEPDAPRTVQLLVDEAGEPGYRLVSQLADDPSSPWIAHSAGRYAPLGGAPAKLDAEAIRARCTGAMTPANFYALIESLGYSTGPGFQCIREIHKGDGESLCVVQAPGAVDNNAIHPGLIDSLLQTVLPACETQTTQMMSGDRVLIPLHMGQLRLFGDLDQRLHCHTRVEVTGEVAKGQISVFGEDGAAVLQIEDFLLKLASRQTLYQELSADAAGSAWVIDWKAFAAPAPTSDEPVSWLVLAERTGWGPALADCLRRSGEDVLELSTQAPEHLAEWVAAHRNGPINIVAARHGSATNSPAECERVAGDVLALARQLGEGTFGDRARLWIVTRRAQSLVREDDWTPAPSLDGPMLWGLGRAIREEMPDSWGGLIDLEATPSEAGVAALIGLIKSAPAGETELALRRASQVYAARLAPLKSGGQAGTPSIKEDEAYFLDKGALRTLDDLRFLTRPRRAPQAGEVEISVRASGLNFRDVLNALGQYPGEAGLLGFEAVGDIVRVGPGVSDLTLGETVIALAAPGSIGSHATLSRALVVRKPATLTTAEAVSLPATFLTAKYALSHLGAMRRGDRVLVHAGAGGVGQAAVQLALAAGCEVFATASSPEKQAHLRAMGVAHVMSSRNTDFVRDIAAATGGGGVDMVLNSLTGEFIAASFQALAPGGRFLEMGKIGIWSEEQARAHDPACLYRPFDLAAVALADPGLLTAMLEEVFDEIAAGRLAPLPTSVFPMAEAQEAFRFMAQARHVGKIVLSREDEFRRARLPERRRIRPDASYLVTGGLGALGQRLARWLAGEGARHIVLSGRNPPGEAAREVIAGLQAEGVAVRVVLADVATAAGSDRLMASLAGQPPLVGVFHAAGVLDDAMIVDVDAARLARVMAPKVTGAWRLHEATRAWDLDAFVVFSSVAAIIGNLGQSAYAAANACMDGLAALRRRAGLSGMSVNWGPWAETGMAASLATDRFTVQGIHALAPDHALEMLGRLLGEQPVQAMVADIDWPTYGRSHNLDGKTGLFAAVVAETAPAAAPAQDMRPKRDIVAELTAALPVERETLLRRFLQELARETLGFGEDEPVAPDQPLVDQGFDSLMSVDMRNRLGRSLGRTLPASLLFDHPTLDRLARHILGSVLQLGDVAAPSQSASELLAEIEKLTA